ncbi:MAG: NADH-quinone oxidoreductase subunit H [Acidobacteria bacterium]|nr:NADH-quinone oxidoreductase subunit H [Acidobacteriota bacterium]
MTHVPLNLLILLAGPVLFVGVVNRVKARWAGRRGAPLLQPLYDIRRLLRKGRVVSPVTTPVFALAPSVNLAALLMAGLMLPLTGGRAVFSFQGDFIVFVYLLGPGKFLTILAALDTGSSFEGMGACREASFSCLVEPAFFLVLGALSAARGAYSFADLLPSPALPGGLLQVALALSLFTFFLMLLTEGCRVPVDDPNTHLELTMIHEVMVLDHSGPDLALIQYAAALKMTVFGCLAGALVIPPAWGPAASAGALAGFLLLTAVAVGVVESLTARLRMDHVPAFVSLMSANGLVVLVILLLGRFGGLS